jgi:hypothetical protein
MLWSTFESTESQSKKYIVSECEQIFYNIKFMKFC